MIPILFIFRLSGHSDHSYCISNGGYNFLYLRPELYLLTTETSLVLVSKLLMKSWCIGVYLDCPPHGRDTSNLPDLITQNLVMDIKWVCEAAVECPAWSSLTDNKTRRATQWAKHQAEGKYYFDSLSLTLLCPPWSNNHLSPLTEVLTLLSSDDRGPVPQ